MMFHPRFSQLNRFSDGDLSGGARARVAGHLAACTRCRRVVQSIREISAQGPQLMLEQPAPDLLDRILERRARGDRVILPLADPQPKSVAGWQVVSVAAALLVIGIAVCFLVLPMQPLRADHSELLFTPEKPEPGAVIQVEYRPSGLLAGEERLVLRARFRRPNDSPYRWTTHQVTAAELERDRDGTFHGSFQLPDSTVYAVFAVEDADGERLDSNGEALWELLTFEGEKQSYQSLFQRYAELMGRNWTEGVRNAEVMTELYPERIESWYALSAFQRWVPGGRGPDSVLAVIAARADSLNRRFATDFSLSEDDVASMYWIALSDARDSAMASFWWTRLSREAPRHPTRVQHLARRTRDEFPDDLSARLVRLEEIWDEYGDAHAYVAAAAYYAASQLEDVQAMSLWRPRVEAMEPWGLWGMAEDFVLYPELREAGMNRVRELISRLDAERGRDRTLRETVSLQRVRHDRTRRLYFATLGKALIDAGDFEAGIDTLELAVTAGWDPAVFSTVADAKLELGDRTGAVQMLSWLAVDPTTDSSAVAQASEAALAVVDSARWETLKAEGRTEMWRRLLAEAAPFASFPDDPVIGDSDGARTSLREIANGRAVLVVLWNQMSGPRGEQALHQVDSTRNRWQGERAEVIVVTNEPPSDELRVFVESEGLDVVLYYDVAGEVKENLNWWVVPSYVVIDGEFRLWYKGDFESSVRVVEALLAREHDIESGNVLVAPQQ